MINDTRNFLKEYKRFSLVCRSLGINKDNIIKLYFIYVMRKKE
jgi:hypothetical protein